MLKVPRPVEEEVLGALVIGNICVTASSRRARRLIDPFEIDDTVVNGQKGPCWERWDGGSRGVLLLVLASLLVLLAQQSLVLLLGLDECFLEEIGV